MNHHSRLSYINRKLSIDIDLHNAFFLWGPRKVGKTAYLKHQFPDATFYDLLDRNLQTKYLLNPSLFREELLASKPALVIVDEVQKLPQLLDDIHWCLENTDIKFILCGSSARKLKRNAANLLGGRAWRYEMMPLTSQEIAQFDLSRALNHGLIPQHYLSDTPNRFLESYILDYFNEEIHQEASSRNIPAFSKFLSSVASSHGQLINYSNIARQCGVSAKTVREYYQILEDTLLGFTLNPWSGSQKYRLIETAKFYLFDPGLVRALQGVTQLVPNTFEYGRAFEHFIINEIRAYLSYTHQPIPLYYWRTSTNLEVDLLVGKDLLAIEIKSSDHVDITETKALLILQEDHPFQKRIVVSSDPHKRILSNGVEVYPWQLFLAELWQSQIL